MSYQSEILADVPVAYYRLDMVGTPTDGDEIPDISGNELTGNLVYEPTPFSGGIPPTVNPYGYPSPIETDAASREFFSWANSGSELRGTSFIRRANASLFNFTGDFAVEAWIRPLVAMYAAVNIPLVGSNDWWLGEAFVSSSQRFAGAVIDSSNATHVSADTSFAFPSFLGQSFHLVVTRAGNTLNLYVNGSLRNTTIVPALATRTSGGDVFIGHLSNLHFHQERVDEAAFYDHALSSMRILAHYEAAFNALFLSGRSNVISTATLDSSEDATPIGYPFRHNWDSALIERITFMTNVSHSRNGDEEGVGIRIKPRRELELNVLLRDDYERRKLRARLWRHQSGLWFAPVLQDIEQVTVAITSGSTMIPVVTSYKDYEANSFIGIRQRSDSGRVIKSEEIRIVAVNVDSVEIETPLVNDYDPHVSFVYPVRRAVVDDSISVTGHTDAIEEIPLTLALLAENEAVIPNRIVPWTPTKMRLGYEVFDPAVWQANNWDETREYSIDRARQLVDYQSGIFSVDSDTDGAAEVFSYRMLLQGREQIAKLLGWFYARVGSLNYLWVPSMQRDIEVLGVSGNVLLIEGTEFVDNYVSTEARRDIAFVYNNNSMVLRRVLRSDGLSPNESLELDNDVPTLVNLRSVSLLKFCRLDGDALEIAWMTNEVAQVAWGFREMLVSPEGVGTHSMSPSHSPSPSLSASSSASPSVSPSPSLSPSESPSTSPSASQSPSSSASPSRSPSASRSPSQSASPSQSPSGSASPSSSASPSV